MEVSKKQFYDWNNFSSGEGDGFYWSQEGSYRIGSQIETRIIENGVSICNSKVEATTQQYLGGILTLNPFALQSFSTFDGEIGRVYANGGQIEINPSQSDNLQYKQILAFGQMIRSVDKKNYVYAFTGAGFSSSLNSGVGRIYRFKQNYEGIDYQLNGTDYTTWELGSGTSTTSGQKIFTISEDDRIIFAHNNSVFQIDTQEQVTKVLALPINCEIKGIFKYLDTYKIYFNYILYNNGIDSYIAYWDGISGQLEQTSKYSNSPIKLVVGNGAYEYVIFGWDFTEDIYYIAGLDRGDPIKINIESGSVDPINTREFFSYTGDVREGIFYFIGENKLGETCIYSFGKFHTGFGFSLVPLNNIGDIIRLEGTNYYDVAIQCFAQGIYLYKDGITYSISSFINSRKEDRGSIVSYPFVGSGMSSLKSIDIIRIAYILGNANNSIAVSVRKEGGPQQKELEGWIEIKRITGQEFLSKRGIRIDRFQLQKLSLGDFYQLEFKIDLVSFNGGAANTYPIFFGLRMSYDDNIKD